jgi:hypothetical protein
METERREGQMTKTWDADRYATTSELLARGWTRRWLNRAFGPPVNGPGNRKLWPREEVFAAERHPAFAYMVARLKDITSRARYPKPEHEDRALDETLLAIEAGQFGPVTPLVKLGPLAAPAAEEFPKADRTADTLTLTWECGGKVVVPTAFLEALRQGLGETSDRLTLAINTVLTDWRCGRVRPEKFQWGRNYFLAAVRNTLNKLRELESPGCPPASRDGELPPQRVLH